MIYDGTLSADLLVVSRFMACCRQSWQTL